MLYSRNGDDGNTTMFRCAKKVSKSSTIVEALGALDEVNSFLGLCKIRAGEQHVILNAGAPLATIITDIQSTLFIIQAELAGFSGTITEQHVIHIEEVTNTIEKELPKIKSFLLSGG
ncbi:MAG: ATP:cob(I)alamin adenosyltransferase, partial [Candidatus Babeliales bacterium]